MSGSLVSAGSGVGPSGDPAPTAPLQGGLLQFLTGAYNLTPGDNNKYLVGSGGSWPLGLPTPAVGLSYRVRNDMGITGTTGTITLTPVSGTIDGLASLPLLAGQDCTLFTDGTNWRTFGLRREVSIGTVTVTNAGSLALQLPPGYIYYRFKITSLSANPAGGILLAVVSNNGGSSWFNTAGNYIYGMIYATSATAVANQVSSTGTYFLVSANLTGGPTFSAEATLFTGPTYCGFEGAGGGNLSGQGNISYIYRQYLNVVMSSPVNAISFYPNSGTFSGSFTVIGGT